MNIQACFVVIVIVVMLYCLVKEYLAPDVILFIVVSLFIITGILPIRDAVSGFSNIGMLTVAVLYIIVGAIQNTGILENFSSVLMGNAQIRIIQIFRLMVPIAGFSAFLNNTPIVAIFIPTLKAWAQKKGFAPSKFLIPLSYAAILGGVCTLIGTSTNLIVNGMMIDKEMSSMGFFEIGKVGLPCAIVGIVCMALIGYRMLPERTDVLEQLNEDFKEFITEMRIMEGCPLIGKSIKAADLRDLKGLFLAKIIRKGKSIPAVSPDEVLEFHDVLVFTGVSSMIVDLQKIKNLIPVTQRKRDIIDDAQSLLVEVVISNTFPFLGKTIKMARFRSHYHASAIAVHRNGARIRSKIGDIILKPGDTLLLFVKPDFRRIWSKSKNFYFISALIEKKPAITKKSYFTVAVLIGMVLLSACNIISVFKAAFIASSILLISGCISPHEARKSVDWQVLIVIACALAIGKALERSGAAAGIAGIIINASKSLGPIGGLAAVYIMTSIMTEVITNNAAAVLMFPIGFTVAMQMGVNPRPFCMAIAVAASASFASPIGYQTNLMVYGPGGYHYKDFLKIGIPFNFLIGILAICLIPLLWSF